MLPPYGLAAVAVLVLYVIESEIRFGTTARSHSAGQSDQGSTRAIKLAVLVPVVGFVLAMKAGRSTWVPAWVGEPGLPGMPAVAWTGIVLGAIGLALRLWAVLTLRERYTRTLLTHDQHAVERGGPYRWVRHPGYLGSLLCLNGVAMASGSAAVLAASLAATFAAYAHRVRAEDRMLVDRFGETYAAYRREVGGLIPFVR
ncbi:MAG TPA: isoprenylcysteine carboxylmethyltransferase family protein [Usitatibacter sp.]|nr:isoprenylcysteine carboxylmethyltransferase family protein [Usitatibacter sp.]